MQILSDDIFLVPSIRVHAVWTERQMRTHVFDLTLSEHETETFFAPVFSLHSVCDSSITYRSVDAAEEEKKAAVSATRYDDDADLCGVIGTVR